MTKREAEKTRIPEEPMRGGELKSNPMEDKRGGVEERKTDKTKQGEEGAGRQAGAGDESGGR